MIVALWDGSGPQQQRSLQRTRGLGRPSEILAQISALRKWRKQSGASLKTCYRDAEAVGFSSQGQPYATRMESTDLFFGVYLHQVSLEADREMERNGELSFEVQRNRLQ